uniref:NACHT, LRR and PYD domains-containing protein 12-like n=1 Tax=Styela clava TaxID=7725 RepID=UPI00193A0A6D|nr:NACHT, LRR and PYD domains-containing protein 12-like [Styela clava]
MMSYQKVIAKINENTLKCTDFYDFAEPFEVFKKKLNVDVTPILEEFDFYKSGRIIEYNYVPGYFEFQKYLEEEKERTSKHDYVPESYVFQKNLEEERRRGIRKETHLDKLFKNFKQGHVCFVGPAGSGKTTIMKATSRNSMHGKYFQGTIKMVQYIQCKQYMSNSKVTAGELIFNNLPKEERGQAIDYAKTHPEEVLFMLDSLDTLQYTVDGVYEIISLDEPAYPEVILWNFLTGKVFPGCRILSSSREHSIRNYWGEVRPNKVIALAGLSIESITEIISGYEGNEEAEKIMEFLKIKAPLLLLLCTTPVTLVYTLIALKLESNFKPNTMTGIMTVVMKSLLRSPHSHQENILEVLNKLKELLYIGTVERRVLFTENDFRQVNLKPEEATDSAILASGGIFRKLLRGIHLLYFQHQSFQEMLTSLYVLGLDLKSFEQFIDKHLHTGHFVFIRKMMCGLLLNPTVYEEARNLLGEIKDFEEKRDILKKSLQLTLKDPKSHTYYRLMQYEDKPSSDLFDLFTALNEAKDGMSDIVKSSLDSIEMNCYPLSISDVHVIGSVASYCTSLSMYFRDCDLKSASLQTLASGLKASNVKINLLNLNSNKNMGVEGLSSVGQILSNQSCVQKLNLIHCNLSSNQLQAFKSSLGNNTEIKKLILLGNTTMGVEGLSSVGQILSNQSCVETLALDYCNLSSDQLQAFKLSLGTNTEIDYLDMSEDNLPKYRANHEKIVAVANLLPIVTEKLALYGWNITDEDEKILQNQLDEIGSVKLQICLYGKTLKCQKKDNEDEDKATNVILKQNPILTSKTEFGTTSRLSNSESTEEKREISKEAKSPRSELLMTEKEAEQSDKEVTEQAAKLTKPKTNITYSQIQEVRAEQIHEVHAEQVVQNVTNIDETSITDSHIQEVRAEQIHAEKFVQNVTNIDGDTSSRTADVKRRRTSDGDSCSSPRSEILKTGTENIQQVDEPSLYGLLKNDIQEAKDTYDLVEVLYKHRDDKKGVISEAIKDLSIKHYNLNDANINVFLTIISKLDKLDMLNVQKCGTSEYLNIFLEKLEMMTNCKIAKISIWGMKELKIYSQSLLKLLKKSETESLMIQACELEKEDVDQLLKDIKSFKKSEYSLRALALSHNSKMGLEDFQKFGEILHILPVKTISLFDCDLTDDKLSNLFASSINRYQL